MFKVGEYVSVSIDKLGRSMKDYDLTVVQIDYSTVRITNIETDDQYFMLQTFCFEFSDGVKIFTYEYNINRYANSEEIVEYVCDIRKNKLKQLYEV